MQIYRPQMCCFFSATIFAHMCVVLPLACLGAVSAASLCAVSGRAPLSLALSLTICRSLSSQCALDSLAETSYVHAIYIYIYVCMDVYIYTYIHTGAQTYANKHTYKRANTTEVGTDSKCRRPFERLITKLVLVFVFVLVLLMLNRSRQSRAT